jgi:hypothetical protein
MVGQDQNNDWDINFSLLATQKEYGLFNVDQIESLTGYDFFSNIPTEIQEKIEGRTVEEIKAMLKSIKPATLLADGFPLSQVGSLFNSTIEHNSFINKIHT